MIKILTFALIVEAALFFAVATWQAIEIKKTNKLLKQLDDDNNGKTKQRVDASKTEKR